MHVFVNKQLKNDIWLNSKLNLKVKQLTFRSWS